MQEPAKLGKFKLWFVERLALMLPPCDVTCQHVSASMETKLPLKQRILVRLHLANCYWCTHFKRQAEFLAAALRHRARIVEKGIQSALVLEEQSKVRMQSLIQRQLEDLP